MAPTHTGIARDAASPLSTQAAEIGWSADLVTNSGIRFHVRPARPSDEDGLGAFFRSLPPEDLRHRFLTGLREVGPARLKEMVRNDDPHAINFLAIDQASGVVIASALLAATEDYSEGEFALSTHPEWQQKGVSWTLLGHLVRYAEAAGISIIKSIETADDAKALQLEREMGFRTYLCPKDATLMIAEKRLAPRR
ncbi:N-acetyltransferase family protein [Allosphingosinicella humi]